MTGTYYLWIMLERQSGEKVKCRSEGFNFDNEGPEITNITTVKSSSTEITLSVEAEDNQSKITKLEAVCYNAADKNRSLEFEAIKQMKQEITIQYDLESLPNMGIVAYDVAGNYSTVSGDVLHTWDCYIGENIQRVYALSCQDYVFNTLYSKGTNGVNKKLWEKVEIDQNTGALSGSGRTILANELDEQTVKCDWWVVDSTSQATLFPGTIFSDASSGYFGDGYIYQPKQFNLPTKSEPSGWRLVDSLPYFPYWLRI